jgi:hypothetical protein
LDEAGSVVVSRKQRYSRKEMETALVRFKSNLAAAVKSASQEGVVPLETVLQLLEEADFGD